MKTFKDFLTETRVYNVSKGVSKVEQSLLDANKGRKVGQPIVDINGKEVKNSTILSNGMANLTVAYKSGANIDLEIYSTIGTTAMVTLHADDIKALKNLI